jgi:hypothetical protein
MASTTLSETVTCRDNSLGYDSIDSLNADIDAEVARIIDGGTPEEAYLYRLCPGSTIMMEGKSLMPKLDGSVFQCGDGGLLADDCRLQGGSDQVIINNSAIPGYSLNDVRFVGVTFTGFTNSAVSGNALYTTTTTIEDSLINVSSFRLRRRNLTMTQTWADCEFAASLECKFEVCDLSEQ